MIVTGKIPNIFESVGSSQVIKPYFEKLRSQCSHLARGKSIIVGLPHKFRCME